MSQKLNVVVIAGTTRENRQTIKAAKLVEEVGRTFGNLEIVFVDVKDYFPLSGEGNDESSKYPKWVNINKKSDAYFIVAPEYNHSFPGSLKMLLDNDLGNYTHKPVAIAGVSAGSFGGARMIENLLPVTRELGMVAISSDLHFTNVHSLFDDSDKVEKQKARAKKVYEELIWMANALKFARNSS